MSLAEQLQPLRSTLAENAAAAGARFRADGTLTGTTRVEIKAGSGHAFLVDEPRSLGGDDAAANPVEYALAALGSCQAITYRVWAALLGLRFDRLEVAVEGDIDLRGFFGVDDGVRPGFQAIRVKVTVDGPETAARYAELTEAVNRHCPVLDLFATPVPVAHELLIAAPAATA
ncbi:OsmC family protein [Zavarzinia compransoris]|uniref:Osmotically inducible protein OsmC n=1 Tax=Zavarzinia compransoris TaxID=1264899 RepID=A0A317DTK2_9PROT|nr:OsmC family protein [Zavarzinia compransoris]PWR17991.1 osmotically inducible protein OsmC [Zavarzinia compransoris]TDP43547.1 putative OsmC-like protein [Zavarzinia compransoris]